MTSFMQSGRRKLGDGYSVEVDAVDEATWYRILEEFNDANIYQTWSYDEVRCGRDNISHIVLKKDGKLAAAAQARIVKLPLIGSGIAYVRWGPLWRTKSVEPDAESFRQAIRALRNEYACNRGLVLRLRPGLFREVSPESASILTEEGFSVRAGAPGRTIRLDLDRTMEELRKGMRPHWRRYLNVAEKINLEVVEGTGDALFEEFVGIYRELVDRKAFVEPNDIREFRVIQQRLPQNLKMRILLCKDGGKLCSGVICSAIGDTAIYVYGATSNAGLKTRGSYLLHWKLIGWLKENRITTYDLHGINPSVNPGTYRFKADLCGANGQDVHFLGQYDSCTNLLSHALVSLGEGARQVASTLKAIKGRAPVGAQAGALEQSKRSRPAEASSAFPFLPRKAWEAVLLIGAFFSAPLSRGFGLGVSGRSTLALDRRRSANGQPF
jgi:lipid II:glycine glycyltransferase (peptidoglycan interpeptide bridge formation enzyme)